MTNFAIQEQIRTIKKASAKAIESKETAVKFLVDAGLFEDEGTQTKKEVKAKKIAKTK